MPRDGVRQKDGKLPRRKVICRARDLTDSVLFICSGWAASLVTLPNGDRQILSFLLPGDIVSSALLFRKSPPFLVETITEVTYRSFDRTKFMQDIAGDPEAIDVL
jgi:CRP-like cAMP-binding protein